MADPAQYRPAPGTVPDEPGVYRFRDEHGRVIYVGKAKSLRSRLGSYFQDLHQLHPRTQTMLTTAAGVDWTVVRTEVESLQLEYAWIKEFDPRFNIRYRDDKSYPWLAVTVGEEYPRLQVMRGVKRPGVRYFGPYAHAWAIRETLDLLLRVFPARTCSAGVFKRHRQMGRPCLLGYIGKCSAPCVGRVSVDEHREIVDDFCDFMAGRTDQLVKRLDRDMRRAADDQEYERAARLRDDLGAVQRAVEKQAVVLAGGTDADVIALAQDALEAAVAVFYVRGGRVRGQRGWVVDRYIDTVEDSTTGALVSQFLEQVYGSELTDEQEQASLDAELRRRKPPAGSGAPGLLDPVHDTAAYRPGPDAPRRRRQGGERDIPREVLVPALPDDAPALEDWLSGLRGSRVLIRVPHRGDKRALLETVERNAKESFQQHKLKRASDLSARSQALADLQEALDLPAAPLRIECYDVSHVQGTDVVASMVVFEDGLARKAEYRRFALKGVDGNDDTAWMHEVITRRFRRLVEESGGSAEWAKRVGSAEWAKRVGSAELAKRVDGVESTAGPIDAETGRPRRFAYPPQLVVVDGGPPQVEAARRAMHALGVDAGPEPVALCGLAKRLEEVWLPLSADPVILPRTSEALYLLQRVRDEAHRFAITYHRQRRSRSMTASALDGIPGLGDTRRKALLRHFGSVKKLRAATVPEVAAVPGVGPATAASVVAALQADEPVPAVDPTTGEVLPAR